MASTLFYLFVLVVVLWAMWLLNDWSNYTDTDRVQPVEEETLLSLVTHWPTNLANYFLLSTSLSPGLSLSLSPGLSLSGTGFPPDTKTTVRGQTDKLGPMTWHTKLIPVILPHVTKGVDGAAPMLLFVIVYFTMGGWRNASMCFDAKVQTLSRDSRISEIKKKKILCF